MASAQRIGSYNLFLPLPSARFDLRSKTLSLDESHIQRYVRKFFYPLGHENLFADVPGILRNVADLLEKEKE